MAATSNDLNDEEKAEEKEEQHQEEAEGETAPPRSPLPESPPRSVESPLELAQVLSSEDFIPDISRYKDHFSLPVSSSTIKFRDSRGAARVIMGSNSQLVLEEIYDRDTNNHAITLKKMNDSSGGLHALRAIYTIETVFFVGFLLALSLQVILFVFLDGAIYLGQTDMQEADYGMAIGIILSVPVFIKAFASALTIAGHLVVDTWKGNSLVKSFIFPGLNIAAVEWMLFLLHLGWPLLIMYICLWSKTDSWWEYTAMTWFLCIFIFYLLFTVNVIYYEVQACWETMKNQYKDDANRRIETYFQAAKHSVFLRMKHTFSGVRETTYLSVSAFANTEDIDRGSTKIENAITEPKERKGIIAWLTQNECFGLYQTLDNPQPLYLIEDAQDQRPYITSSSWSLEKGELNE